MKKFFEEFKAFAVRGNIIDLSVGVIIGGAFTAIVTSLTQNFIQPILDLVTRAHPQLYTINEIMGYFSSFITAVINFVITAFVLFIILKTVNKIATLGKKEESEKPTTKTCPYCKSEIAIDAVKCPHCTADIEE